MRDGGGAPAVIDRRRDAGVRRRGCLLEEPARGMDEAIETPVPRALAIVYRDPYGVALIIGPFNGPHLLLFRPGDTVKVLAKMGLLKKD